MNSRRGRRKAQQKSNKRPPLLVHTVYGNCLLDSDARVFVKIGGKRVPKPATQLSPGEEVIIKKEGIPGITIEKVNGVSSKCLSFIYPII
jgi:hypothetical protein